MNSTSEFWDRVSLLDPSIIRCNPEAKIEEAKIKTGSRVTPKVTKTSLDKLRKIIGLLGDWCDNYHFMLPGLPMGQPISLTVGAFQARMHLREVLEELEKEYEPNQKR